MLRKLKFTHKIILMPIVGAVGVLLVFATVQYFSWRNEALIREDGEFNVIPRDGLRRRFHVLLDDSRIHLELDRDGFAAERLVQFPETLKSFRFHLENRTQDAHTTILKTSGLSPGSYVIELGSIRLEFVVREDRENTLELPIPSEALVSVAISRTGATSRPDNRD